VIPRDVRTRWNLVYDMVAAAIGYKAVFNDLTANGNLDYRKFDIMNAEWTLVEDMLHVLKVLFPDGCRASRLTDFRCSRMRHCIFHPRSTAKSLRASPPWIK
jgi:hypothetical protein